MYEPVEMQEQTEIYFRSDSEASVERHPSMQRCSQMRRIESMTDKIKSSWAKSF